MDGEQWTNTNSFAVNWVLLDMRAVLLNDGAVGTGADMLTRWTEYRGAP